MYVRTICCALILGGSMAAMHPISSLAQSSGMGTSATQQPTPPPVTSTSTTPNTNTNPTKHRHWRHRGGVHPHYGSRRVRT